jgi:glycosyltransferase involved in cell wall biosynthesis
MVVSKKKIAVLCNYELLPERVGGMDYFFWAFDKKCKENNIAVDWFFPNISAHGNYADLNIISSKKEDVAFFFTEFIQQNNSNYTEIITHFVEVCGPIFKKISKLSDAKIICVDHNPRPLEGYSIQIKIKKRLKGFLYSNHIYEFIAVSNYSKSQLIKEFGSKISNKLHVIPNGLAFEKFEKKTDYTFQNKFLIASHLRKDKGIQDVIEAVAELYQETKLEISVAVFGAGFYEEELKELCKKYGIASFFNFKGSVNNLNEIYKNYDYLIHPSHGETFCYSVVEALVCNLPVITTKNQGNVLGLIQENYNGFLFEECNVLQLKNILIQIISNKHQIDAFVNCNPELKQLTLGKMVENYYNLLN